jgi:hypothetical protein
LRDRREVIAKLAEYGVLSSIVLEGLLVSGLVLYSTVVSGVITYSVILREPGWLGKIVLMTIVLVVSLIVAWTTRLVTRLEQVRVKRKGLAQPEVSSRVMLLVVALAILVLCYALICFYRAY